MDALMTILLILAVLLFVGIALFFLVPPLRRLVGGKDRDMMEEDLPFDYIPSRTMAEKNLVWQDRRKGPRRSEDLGEKAAKPPPSVEDVRSGDDRRRTSMRPPYPAD